MQKTTPAAAPKNIDNLLPVEKNVKLLRKFDITDLVLILFFKKLKTEEINDEGRS